jgi:hypothetical protein
LCQRAPSKPRTPPDIPGQFWGMDLASASGHAAVLPGLCPDFPASHWHCSRLRRWRRLPPPPVQHFPCPRSDSGPTRSRFPATACSQACSSPARAARRKTCRCSMLPASRSRARSSRERAVRRRRRRSSCRRRCRRRREHGRFGRGRRRRGQRTARARRGLQRAASQRERHPACVIGPRGAGLRATPSAQSVSVKGRQRSPACGFPGA